MRERLLKNMIQVQVGNVDDPIIKSNDTREEKRNIASACETDEKIDSIEEKLQIIEDSAASLEKDKVFTSLLRCPRANIFEENSKD